MTIFIFSTVIYAALLILFCIGLAFQRCKACSRGQGISIIVAARNEQNNLPRLLRAFTKLEYPTDKFEVIIVNDRSTDRSYNIIKSWQGLPNLRILQIDETSDDLYGKKAAINHGIAHAQYDLLAFTDADCVPHPHWLKAIDRCFDENTDYLLGYTLVKRGEESSLYTMKNFERSIYYVLAAAGFSYRLPITSSASNMAYRKSLFHKAGGFAGIGHIQSGDDDLLLMKMMPFIRKARFCTESGMMMQSVENTDPHRRYNANIRKASKWFYFPLWLQITSLFVLIYFGLSYIYMLRLFWGFSDALYPIIIKSAAELCLVSFILLRIKMAALIPLYPLMVLRYPLQFVYFGLRGSLGKYRWK